MYSESHEETDTITKPTINWIDQIKITKKINKPKGILINLKIINKQNIRR